MRGERAALGAAVCLAVSACTTLGTAERSPAAAAASGATVAAEPADAGPPGARTYSGAYSCDGCVERMLTVTVFADGRYRLREVPARGEPVREQGRWSVAPQAPDRLVLESSGGTRVLRRTASDALTIVDPEGRELHGLVGGVLVRAQRVDPLPASRRVTGFYRAGGGPPVLVDCASGTTLRVLAGASGSPQAALDAAWRELAPRDGETVLVVVHAHEAAAPAGRAAGAPDAIVVEAFERATRNGRCAEAPPQHR